MISAKPGTFEYLEAKIRREAKGRSYGRDFERICKWFLLNAPQFRGKFYRVYLWHEWPGKWEVEDGVDLVAETHNKELWAIQAKAYDPRYYVKKSDIDSWITASGDSRFTHRLLIATTDHIGITARRAMSRQSKPTTTITRGLLLDSTLQWPAEIGMPQPKAKPWKPKSHQQKAIKSVLAGFVGSPRGRLIMACGTGKTLTALWINEALESTRTLVLAPSIALVHQSLIVWGRHARTTFDSLVVCSDSSVGTDLDPAVRHVADLAMDATTDIAMIRRFLLAKRKRPVVVFCTYHSSARVSAAQKNLRHTFDLMVCDEAHRLAGDSTDAFSAALDGRRLRAHRRLFMTATPVYSTDKVKSQAKDEGKDFASMDDEAKFGPEFYSLSFRQAIEAKPEPILTDYRVVVVGVTSSEVARMVKFGGLVRTKHRLLSDARTVATAIAVAKAMRKYDLRQVLTFHRSIKRARDFVDPGRPDSLPGVLGELGFDSRMANELWAGHISGKMAVGVRRTLLKALGDLNKEQRGVISNCACLSEGVDVPELDGICFVDPKRSVVDIVQAIGRVIRRSAKKKLGTVVLPVFIQDGLDVDETLESSAFRVVWQVLKAIRAHDAQLAQVLDQLRSAIGKERTVDLALPSQVVFDCGGLLPRGFEQSFYVRAVKAAADRTFEYWLGLCDEWCECHGKSINNLTAMSVIKKAQVGKWLSNQRTAYRLGKLSDTQVSALEARGILWSKRSEVWDRKVGLFRAWCRQHGKLGLAKRSTVFQGQKLGRLLEKVRTAYRAGQLSTDKISFFEQLGMVWEPHSASFEAGLKACERYLAEGGSLVSIPKQTVIEGFSLSKWVEIQRRLYRSGELSQERIDSLLQRGMVWDPESAKESVRRDILRRYVEVHGSLANIKQKDVFEGVKIGVMMNHRRRFYRDGLLQPAEIRFLEELGMVWEPLEAERKALISALIKIKNQQGGFGSLTNSTIIDGLSVGKAVARWRARLRKGVLDPFIRKECRRIGLDLFRVKGPGGLPPRGGRR